MKKIIYFCYLFLAPFVSSASQMPGCGLNGDCGYSTSLTINPLLVISIIILVAYVVSVVIFFFEKNKIPNTVEVKSLQLYDKIILGTLTLVSVVIFFVPSFQNIFFNDQFQIIFIVLLFILNLFYVILFVLKGSFLKLFTFILISLAFSIFEQTREYSYDLVLLLPSIFLVINAADYFIFPQKEINTKEDQILNPRKFFNKKFIAMVAVVLVIFGILLIPKGSRYSDYECYDCYMSEAEVPSYYYDDSWDFQVFTDIEHKDAPLPEWWIDGDWPLDTVENPPKILKGETPRILFWWAAYLHYYDTEKKQWFVEPDSNIAMNSYDLLSFCRRYYPDTITVKKYKKENIPLARDDNNYVLAPDINPWSFECVQ